MQARDATPFDRSAIRAFRCTTSKQWWYVEVQKYVHAVLEWRAAGEDRRVKLVFDDATLVAVAAYEPFEPGNLDEGFFLSFLAVELSYQGRGIGAEVMAALVRAMGREAPGARLVWRVHPKNAASRRVCEKLGYVPEDIPEGRPFLTYTTDLPVPT